MMQQPVPIQRQLETTRVFDTGMNRVHLVAVEQTDGATFAEHWRKMLPGRREAGRKEGCLPADGLTCGDPDHERV